MTEKHTAFLREDGLVQINAEPTIVMHPSVYEYFLERGTGGGLREVVDRELKKGLLTRLRQRSES